MANIKNFGLDGVASSVQLGKGGSKIQDDSGKIVVTGADGSTLTNVQAAEPVVDQDLTTKNYVDSIDGMRVVLGTPTDSSLSDGAVALTPSFKVTDAVDALNEILGKLVPASPPSFPGGQSLTISSTSSTALLASGSVPDNTSGGSLPVTAGNSVTRVTSTTVNTSTIGDNGTTGFVGPGDSGTVQALVNNTVVDSQAMSTGDNSKSTGVLRISNDQAYPLATPGFWESFRANITGASATQGWNRLKLNHTAAGATTDLYFVRDNITANPVVSGGSVTEGTQGTLAYSSSIPHYNTGAVLTVGFNATNLSGETYKSGTILSVSASNSILSTNNYAAGQGGLANPLARQTTSFTASGLSINIDGTNVHNSGQLTATASNPNGSGSSTFGPIILVKRGTVGSRVDEMNIPVSIAVNGGPSATVASRTVMAGGDFPSTDVTSLTVGNWVSSSALNTYDATIVGGVLKQDQTNYTTGYLPAGPNLSGQDGTQYVTFLIRRTAVSKFDISVTGTYAGLFVKLPGLSDSYTASSNGWYTMSTLYSGAGIPGDTNGANGSLGVALGQVASGTGSWTCTFGSLSSTNASNNIILVRFKLTAGQSITALSFVPATR